MAQIAVAGAGSAEENVNLINPRFQAEALRQLRGYDVGVLKNTFYTTTSATGTSRTANNDFMWRLNASGGITAVKVGRGMATAYGYDIQSEAEVTLAGTVPASGTKYVFIYLEWDLHNPNKAIGSIKLRDNGTSSSWTPSNQNNLITNPTGIYQMILYRLAVNTAGTITATANWESFGVKTIGYPLRAEHASHTEDADHADQADNADYASSAGTAEYGTYATGNRNAGTIDARLNSLVSRLNTLGFKTGTISVNSGISSSSLTKLGNYVIGYITCTLSSTDLGTIPSGFRPYTSKQTAAYVRGYNASGRVYTYSSATITFGTDGSIRASTSSNFDLTKTIIFGWDTTAGGYN